MLGFRTHSPIEKRLFRGNEPSVISPDLSGPAGAKNLNEEGGLALDWGAARDQFTLNVKLSCHRPSCDLSSTRPSRVGMGYDKYLGVAHLISRDKVFGCSLSHLGNGVATSIQARSALRRTVTS